MTWTAVASLPEGLNGPACAEHGGKLYAFGGDSSETHAYVYDPGTDSWSAIADITTGFISAESVAFGLSDGKIYLFRFTSGPAWFSKYDPVADTYSSFPDSPGLGAGVAACSDGVKVYFLEFPTGSSDQLPQVSVYDPATGTWSTTGTTCPVGIAPNGLAWGGCFYKAGVIYCFNGWPNAAATPDGVVVTYTVATDTWAAETTEATPKEAFVPTLGGLDKFPLIGGDSDTASDIAGVDVYDPAGSTWTSYAALPAGADGPNGAVCGSYVYVVGGFISGSSTANVFRAPLADFTSGGGGGAATGMTTVRTARTFTATPVPAIPAALAAARTARTFGLAASTLAYTSAGRPDADTATGWTRRRRGFLADIEVIPPVALPPADRPPTLYRIRAYSYTAPDTAADGWSHPTQDRTLLDGSLLGRHRFRFDGVDRTYFCGVPMRLVQDSHANPLGPEIAEIHCPQISPIEAKPSWLHDGTRVIIDLIDENNILVPGWSWRGFCHNFTPELTADGWGLSVEAKGFFYEGDDAENKPLPVNRGSDLVPIGYRVADVYNAIETRSFTALARVDTSPATTRQRGSISQKVNDFARELFGQAWTADGRQWTLLDVPGANRGHIVLPDPSHVDYTLSAGQDGVTFELHEELDELPNVVYGEWIDPDGGRHQQLKYPRLHEDRSPAYPLTVGDVFDPGDGQTGFRPFSDWMRRNGFAGFDSGDTYLASDEDDVRAAQKRMGITVDGVVGAQTWGTAFNTGADVGDLFNSVYLPIAYDIRVMRYLYAPDGTVLGENPAFDPTVRRKETYINFGEGLTYREVRRSAEQIVARSTTGVSLVGQITVKGTDFEEGSTLLARAGTTLRVRYLYGTGTTGVHFHMARIARRYDDDGGVEVTLDVDTKWRDAYTVAQIIERNRAAKDDPARLLRRRQTSGLSQDTKLQYDADDIGRIYRHNVQGGFWRIVEFPAASWGTFASVTAVTSPATEFVLMLFSKEITARDLDRLVGNPLSSARPYSPNASALAEAGYIQAWGSADQPAGYSKPGVSDGWKSDGDPLTGRLEYDSSTDFAPANGASLFLAEYCSASTVIQETLKLAPVAV